MQPIHPSFNLATVLGLLAEPVLPIPLVQLGVNKLTQLFTKQHPEVIQRMQEYAPACLVLSPNDLPICFIAEFMHDSLHITVVAKKQLSNSGITTITAPLALFIQMLEGDLDGDALFFSRKISVDGDTTLLVALRNILEAQSIDINKDMQENLGMLLPVINVIKDTITMFATSMDNKLNVLQQAILQDIPARIRQYSQNLSQQQQDIDSISKNVTKLENKLKSLRIKLREN